MHKPPERARVKVKVKDQRGPSQKYTKPPNKVTGKSVKEDIMLL